MFTVIIFCNSVSPRQLQLGAPHTDDICTHSNKIIKKKKVVTTRKVNIYL